MRPVRLSLQAFGPFATTEVVDFRSALETGLFGIYGQTGAGKSTLLRLIEGLIAPDDGQVTRPKELRVASLPQVVPAT